MSQDVAARLAALSQDHREGRLTVSAYRSLRAPLLDMLVTPEPVASAEPTITRELVPRSEVAPAALDSDPFTTTRPRHRPLLESAASSEPTGLLASADSLVEASAVAHTNLQAAVREEQRDQMARRRRLQPIAIGVALLVVAGGLIAAWKMQSPREAAPPTAATASPAMADSKIDAPASHAALTPMPPPLPSDPKRTITAPPAAVAAADATGCELQAGSTTAAAMPCRDRLSATEFGPRMLLLAGATAHSAAFAISARPVSQAQFRMFCQRTSRPYPRQPWTEDDDPVVNVTWDEARDYLTWLSATTGRRYRLATEAEWLYFAGQGKIETRWRSGNVREWMQDGVDEPLGNADGLAADAAEFATASVDVADVNDREPQRVVRGVSYADPAAELLIARRARDASIRDALTGFRALREVP